MVKAVDMRHNSARKRGLLTITGVGLTAVLALSGCQVEQGAAIFVGDERIEENVVDSYLDEVVEQQDLDLPELEEADVTDWRQEHVGMIVWVELNRQRGHEAANVTTASWGDSPSLSDLENETDAYIGGLLEEIDESELEEYQDTIVDIYATEYGLDLSAFMEEAETNPELAAEVENQLAIFAVMAQAHALTNVMQTYVDESDVTVNPRYGSVEFSFHPPDLEQAAADIFRDYPEMFTVEIPTS